MLFLFFSFFLPDIMYKSESTNTRCAKNATQSSHVMLVSGAFTDDVGSKMERWAFWKNSVKKHHCLAKSFCDKKAKEWFFFLPVQHPPWCGWKNKQLFKMHTPKCTLKSLQEVVLWPLTPKSSRATTISKISGILAAWFKRNTQNLSEITFYECNNESFTLGQDESQE